jgi:hypothetical protein
MWIWGRKEGFHSTLDPIIMKTDDTHSFTWYRALPHNTFISPKAINKVVILEGFADIPENVEVFLKRFEGQLF